MVDLTFLGTRGELAIRSRRHRRHSSLLIQYNDARIMIDCGADWLGRLSSVSPTAIVLTHAHPDHAWGLAKGAPCPVYASKETLDLLHGFPIRDRREMPSQESVLIDGVRFKAYPVQHSVRAPAVGYRVSAKGARFFYVPDVAGLPDAPNTLRGISVYIGDGATMTPSMVRKKNGTRGRASSFATGRAARRRSDHRSWPRAIRLLRHSSARRRRTTRLCHPARSGFAWRRCPTSGSAHRW